MNFKQAYYKKFVGWIFISATSPQPYVSQKKAFVSYILIIKLSNFAVKVGKKNKNFCLMDIMRLTLST